MSGAVAVGVFDGVHLGHAAILARARARAADGPLTVVSFDPHPDVVLRKSFEAPPPLTGYAEKQARLAACGVDRFEVLPFTRELAALEPEAFVDAHLVAPFHPRWLVVGENFALGRGRAGTPARLAGIGRTRGFEVEAVPLLEQDGAPITSTRIRARLAEGRVAEAARLLGRCHVLHGRVVTGEAIGRTLGFPTANLRLDEDQMVPGLGIYAVRARIEGDDRWRPGAMSVGVRPTFGGQLRTLEVHLLDWSGDLVGRGMAVEFVEWLRAEKRFAGAAELIEAMRADVAETRRILGVPERTPGRA